MWSQRRAASGARSIAVGASKPWLYLNSMDGHGAPATANLQNMIGLADACLLYQRVQLVELRLLQ